VITTASMTSPSIHLNLSAQTWRYTPSSPSPPSPSESPILTFHKHLPFYTLTPLHSLPTLASELNLSHVLVKDESSRFGLPAFKILGASWTLYRAVCDHLDLAPLSPETLEAGALGRIAREKGLVGFKVVTTTEGNWGRAMAKMGLYFGVDVVVYVPGHMVEGTRELIRGEGAEVGE